MDQRPGNEAWAPPSPPASPALCGATNSSNPPGNGAVFPGKPLSSVFSSQAAMFFGDVVKAEPDLSR